MAAFCSSVSGRSSTLASLSFWRSRSIASSYELFGPSLAMDPSVAEPAASLFLPRSGRMATLDSSHERPRSPRSRADEAPRGDLRAHRVHGCGLSLRHRHEDGLVRAGRAPRPTVGEDARRGWLLLVLSMSGKGGLFPVQLQRSLFLVAQK